MFYVYLGVDTRVVPLSTSVAPGHNTLQLTVADNGATRVTLLERENKTNTKNLKKMNSVMILNRKMKYLLNLDKIAHILECAGLG